MVEEAYHTNEQTSRTLEYAYDDFAVAQMAKALMDSCRDASQRQKYQEDYNELIRRSENWRNVINPVSGWADGRYENGKWLNNKDLVHRQSFITEGATCHYTWYVPQNPEGLFDVKFHHFMKLHRWFLMRQILLERQLYQRTHYRQKK